MVHLNFDAQSVEPHTGFDPIPNGSYTAVIISSDLKANRAGNGRYLELGYLIIDGPHKNRKLWSRHNLEHPNPKTVEIAQGELSSVCRAVSVLTPQDSTELHNRPLSIKVKITQRGDTGATTNDIAAWSAVDNAHGAVQSQAATPPWARRSV